jgi:hypothetical protein
MYNMFHCDGFFNALLRLVPRCFASKFKKNSYSRRSHLAGYDNPLDSVAFSPPSTVHLANAVIYCIATRFQTRTQDRRYSH